MKIHGVEFVKSAVKPAHYPEYDFPEIAFAGRSNVGKSSLINTLIQRKGMVKTSSRPGCTQLINFFLVNDDLSFVEFGTADDCSEFDLSQVRHFQQTWSEW